MCIFAQIYKNKIITNNTSTTNQTTCSTFRRLVPPVCMKPMPTRDRVMASTMYVDDYFDGLIS